MSLFKVRIYFQTICSFCTKVRNIFDNNITNCLFLVYQGGYDKGIPWKSRKNAEMSKVSLFMLTDFSANSEMVLRTFSFIWGCIANLKIGKHFPKYINNKTDLKLTKKL